MAKASGRAGTITTLVIGQVKVAVGLFSTVAEPSKLAKFDTGGPNGGVLHARPVARAVPILEQTDQAPEVPVHSSDPFADALAADPGPDPAAHDAIAAASEPTGEMMQAAAAEMLGGDGVAAREVTWPEPDPARSEGVKGWVNTHASVPGEYGSELVEDGTGVVVLPQDVRQGVRLEDGRFIDCTEQLAAIDRTTKLEQMTVVGFVDISRVPRITMKGAQYIGAADEDAPRALRLLFEGLKATRRAAVVKLTKRSRQTLGVIGWLDGVLVLYELVWSEDFRPPPARAVKIRQAQVSEREVAAISDLIRAMGVGPEVVAEMRDDAIALREELKGKALAGEVAEVVTPVSVDAPEDDVMAQLEASLAAVSS